LTTTPTSPPDFNRPRWWSNPRFILIIYLLLTAAFTGIQLLKASKDGSFAPGGTPIVKAGTINNFLIFRTSFDNLVANNDLYAQYPDKHYDLYKYSPTFALLMAPFRALPVGFGLLAWNLCNALVLFWAARSLKLTRRGKAMVLWFVLPALVSAVQNVQSNGLMAGLMLGTFASLERRRIALAALLVCLGFYIKVFGAAAAILFILYDRKLPFLVWCAAFGLALGLLPLPFTGHDGLINQYRSWLELLRTDEPHDMNLSVVTVIERWFGTSPPNATVLLPALVLLALPLVRAEVRRSAAFRMMYAGGLLLWVVIFNHKAESPTYIIAAAGVALWAMVEPPSVARSVLFIGAFILTGFSHGDLFPRYVRDQIIWKYGLKAVPCIIIWGLISYRLLRCRADVLAPGGARYLPSDAGTTADVPKA
jgi:hypothetical protein